jgi:hypothetical protein
LLTQEISYGLKQAPRSWYDKINNFFLRLGFKHCESDHSLYVLHTNGNTFIVVVYVDDLIITGNNIDLILRLKKKFFYYFDMKYLGTLHYFLRLQFLPSCDGFFISQYKYAMDLFTCFKMAFVSLVLLLFNME